MTIRVLVVEDSLTVRKRLIEILNAAPEFEVVGEADDGKRAIELCQQLRPDVITLDMMLPVMTGLAATEYIMAYFPTPILIVSASTNRGELFRTYEALAAGAVDVLDKPGDEGSDAWEERFISTLRIVARVRVITHPRARLGALSPSARSLPSAQSSDDRYRVVGLGASTGGPGALLEVLRTVTPLIPLPVLVVLHLNERFGAAFAEWLDGQSPIRVVYASDKEPVGSHNGMVVLAPPGLHLIVNGGRLRLTASAERHACRPSVDVLFESIAREYGASAVACLLTGMGRDGASGLLEIRAAGGRTIAQDEASSVVYGMPREAAAIGGAEQILPLSQIGPRVTEIIRASGGLA